ncbi:hypothetical protein FRX31_002648 [Thalictrum thalictroides]|uniref:Uncharacterized protein n=1 Tax=Thalictrum thalictroides TaxID=46969 RepID=A0A7J6XDD9_THATH|nr:hypothetical protein FRX31_002648 [Thalictrum thalictroides]
MLMTTIISFHPIANRYFTIKTILDSDISTWIKLPGMLRHVMWSLSSKELKNLAPEAVVASRKNYFN